MINLTPEVILSWPTPNYVNPETRGLTLAAVNHTFLALCIILVALRLYTRIWIVRWFGLDDVFIAIALILSIGVNVGTYIGSSKYGWGRHIWDIPLDWAIPSLKTAYATRLFFNLSANATALSLLVFYYRLIDQANIRWFSYALWSVFAFNLITWFIFFMAQVLICIPVQAAWAIIKPETAKCIDEGVWTIVGGSLKTFVDLLVTTLPIPLILKMNMNKAQKYGLAFLLGLGYVVTAAGALRTYYSWRVYYEPSYDYTWEQFPAFVSSAVENNLSVICACIPTLRPLFAPIFGPPLSFIQSKIHSIKKAGTGRDVTGLSAADSSKQSSTLKAGNADPAAASDRKLIIQKRESFELKDTRFEVGDLEAAQWGRTRFY
ncbi:hypothetical protein P152DRAFT_388605 [Eremomyces bilateralis CBS 781.70]|uniref:Rhodopsin domain-containing protein n=1 Tax=Eremomyces bilateralis CBS 781.70 TaxID=1392243 RepID=A0A6G1GFD2_9PEZI|nr:uncharacterized protein P152DRAFT_388605 [Eremomyces bilateralis CBS 781.70]KAF1816763.1 hypothetical protein P152DRAFT_388605 [Eremomyces bilateralis CBS 781.70]